MYSAFSPQHQYDTEIIAVYKRSHVDLVVEVIRRDVPESRGFAQKQSELTRAVGSEGPVGFVTLWLSVRLLQITDDNTAAELFGACPMIRRVGADGADDIEVATLRAPAFEVAVVVVGVGEVDAQNEDATDAEVVGDAAQVARRALLGHHVLEARDEVEGEVDLDVDFEGLHRMGQVRQPLPRGRGLHSNRGQVEAGGGVWHSSNSSSRVQGVKWRAVSQLWRRRALATCAMARMPAICWERYHKPGTARKARAA